MSRGGFGVGPIRRACDPAQRELHGLQHVLPGTHCHALAAGVEPACCVAAVLGGLDSYQVTACDPHAHLAAVGGWVLVRVVLRALGTGALVLAAGPGIDCHPVNREIQQCGHHPGIRGGTRFRHRC